jgi:chromosome partitioning protein
MINNTQIIAITNQKGGVGKTTTAINLATALSAIDKKVLIIDLDPQGNASTGLGIDISERSNNIYNVLLGDYSVDSAAIKTDIPNLSILPSTVDLAAAEVELNEFTDKESRLKAEIKKINSDFDYIIIDCPPALGFLTVNALVAADKVIVPLQCEFFALEGISHLVKTIQRIKRVYNPSIEIEGIVLTMYDRRNNLSDMVAKDVKNCFGSKVYETIIPRNVRVSEAPSHGKPIMLYDFNSTGAQAYLQLAKEFVKRNENNLLQKVA